MLSGIVAEWANVLGFALAPGGFFTGERDGWIFTGHLSTHVGATCCIFPADRRKKGHLAGGISVENNRDISVVLYGERNTKNLLFKPPFAVDTLVRVACAAVRAPRPLGYCTSDTQDVPAAPYVIVFPTTQDMPDIPLTKIVHNGRIKYTGTLLYTPLQREKTIESKPAPAAMTVLLPPFEAFL